MWIHYTDDSKQLVVFDLHFFFFFFYGNLANRRNLTELISIVRDRQWSVAKNDDVAQVVAMTAYISGYEIWETDMDDSYD